jgi:glycosyltransferase involved in cell wall biosynthesis
LNDLGPAAITHAYPIGIDYTPAIEQGGGIGRYVRELVAALASQDALTPYQLFVAGVRRSRLPPVPGANFQWRSARLSPRTFARFWHRLRLLPPIESWTGPLSLFHATDFVLPPTRLATRTILTVHDLSFVRAPETASPRLKRHLDRVVPRSVARADHILADSQATKDDLISLYRTPAEKITVLYSGVEARFAPVRDERALRAVRARYGIGAAPYVLSVGTVQPRKNYVRLIEAMCTLPDHHLVIAGGRGWLEGPIHAAARHPGVCGRVHFIGFAADADLPALYSAADVFAYPSLYEGFGLPILEAMACGVPVVAANTSSLPEVAGDAALLVDPTSTDELAGALCRVLTDRALRAELCRRGFAQARRFSWDAAADQLQAIYRQMLLSADSGRSRQTE